MQVDSTELVQEPLDLPQEPTQILISNDSTSEKIIQEQITQPDEPSNSQDKLCPLNVSSQSINENFPTDNNNNSNIDDWTTREKLLLISFVLINGDSNWSYLCEQINKLNQSSRKKTASQCSKQYRNLLKFYLNKSQLLDSNKNELIDLKKIYNELAEERLNQVNKNIQHLKDQYKNIVQEINHFIDLELDDQDDHEHNQNEPKFNLKFLSSIIKWIKINNQEGFEVDSNDRYHVKLIKYLNDINSKESNEINLKLIRILEKDAEVKRDYDERIRLAELERLEKEQREREAQLERIRLQQQQEEEEKKRLQEQERLEKLKEQEDLRLKQLEQEQKQKEEIKQEAIEEEHQQQQPHHEEDDDEENSKDSSKFSSEDDMPLLNIIKNRSLLSEKVKSPTPPVVNEKSSNEDKPKTRRSLRKNNKDEPGSPSQVSSVSSCVSISTLSHKSVSLSCSSMSEIKEEQKSDVKASSSTSSVYDNFDVDENHDIFKKRKTKDESLGNLVHVNIKQEPETQLNETETQTKINTSSSSSSSGSDEKAYRAWKKSIMMILNNISCHKHATIFMHPVKDEIAPGYSNLIHRPIDLSTIKKNLENGTIRTTKEFQRDIMLMFTNALMYNSSNHNIHKIALEMFKEVLGDIEQLLNAQEAMGNADNLENYKPSRCKEMRSSSTASDGKASSILSQVINQDQDEVASLLKKKVVKNNSKSSLKDENDNSSIKSNSSVSTPRQSIARTKSQKSTKTPKVETTPPPPPPAVGKKRKPSVTTSTTNLNSSSSSTNSKEQQSKDKDEEPPKSKRRKSGR